jgi:LAO/AO transport system kinase
MPPKRLSPKDYYDGILASDRVAMGRSITLVESNLPPDQALARTLLEMLMQHTGSAFRIGISGPPGVGKSTFIEAFGTYLTSLGKKVAVLVIDPSSDLTRGSILGDKTRMEMLSCNPNAFVRPSATGGITGGVARKTREAMYICEAAGYDVILVETVGVGQSETSVRGMTDFFLLLALPGSGDGLQGIKKGIMEMADGIVVTKADADNIARARLAKAELQNSLHYARASASGWSPKVLTCSSVENQGISEVWDMLNAYFNLMQGEKLAKIRISQRANWLRESVKEVLFQSFFNNVAVAETMNAWLQRNETSVGPYSLADELVKVYRQGGKG